MDEPYSHVRRQVLRDYAAGRLGTREAIERAGLEDYDDVIVGLARNGLEVPGARVFAGARRPHRTARRDASAAAATMTIGIMILVVNAAPLIYLIFFSLLPICQAPKQV